MELVVSAVVGDLVSRSLSFFFNKYKSHAQSAEKKMERLQDLVVRAHMIVEEAEMRYITNSKMLLQLKKLLEVMYQGYLVLDTNRYRTQNEVSSRSSSESSSTTCIKRLFSCVDLEIQPTMDNLESVLSNMKEFVFLLEGCERMFRSPYDSYLYIDNFMFGRHVEKQQIINILLQDNPPPFTPTVLPVIGGVRVGKKTLIAHVCCNEKIRSQFSSVLHLHLNAGDSSMELDAVPVMPSGKSLLVLHFASDVEDEVWLKFYSSVAKQMVRGSKIVIVSKIRMLSTFGTVKPICLNSLSHQEYIYLFKLLAFGSTNPEEHPRLASVAKDLAEALTGSLVTANLYAHLLRKNQHVSAWLCILQRFRNVVDHNMSIFGEHPKHLMDKEQPMCLAPLSSSISPIRMRSMPPQREIDASKGLLPKVMLGDLIVGLPVLPKEDFQVVVWESRIAPYKRFVHLATYCDDEELAVSSHYHTASPRRKRRRLDK